MEFNLSAQDLQLFTVALEPGDDISERAAAAAEMISWELTHAVATAEGIEEPAQKAAGAVWRHMSLVLRANAEVGADDTEPRWIVRGIIADHFGLGEGGTALL